jgi:hypothetical protein
MLRWMMLCEIICEIFTSWAQINIELFLADSVGQPMVSHIHCFRSLFLDCLAHNTESSGVICSQGRWGLCVAQLGEFDSERGATLGVVKARSNFWLCSRGHRVFDDVGDIKDGSVKFFLLGGIVAYSEIPTRLINYSHSRNPPCAPARTHGRIQAPREPPN